MTNYEQILLLRKVKTEMIPVMKVLESLNKLINTININKRIILCNVYEGKYSSSDISGARNNLINEVNKFVANYDMIHTIQVFTIFKKSIEKYIEDGELDILGDKNTILDTANKLPLLATKLYDYIGKRDVKLIYNFNVFFDEVFWGMTSLYNFITNLVEGNLINDIEFNDEYSELTISYNMISNNIDDYIQYLDSINMVYSKVCNIIGISMNEECKLKVIKIESGSFFEKLFGIEKVIELTTYIVKRIVDAIFRKFTIDGKISTLVELQNILNTDADLMQKYIDSGADIEVKKEDIELMHGMIVKSVQKMTQKTTGIKINDVKLDINENFKEKYIQDNKKLMIE